MNTRYISRALKCHLLTSSQTLGIRALAILKQVNLIKQLYYNLRLHQLHNKLHMKLTVNTTQYYFLQLSVVLMAISNGIVYSIKIMSEIGITTIFSPKSKQTHKSVCIMLNIYIVYIYYLQLLTQVDGSIKYKTLSSIN